MDDFVMHRSFRKYWVYWVTQIFQMLTHFFFSIKTITFIGNTSNLISKALKYWLKMADINVPKFDLFLQAIFLELTGSRTSFARNYLPKSQDWITKFIICRVCSLKKAASSGCRSNCESALWILSISSQRVWKKCTP